LQRITRGGIIVPYGRAAMNRRAFLRGAALYANVRTEAVETNVRIALDKTNRDSRLIS